MTAAVRTPWRPDDAPRNTHIIATVPAAVGHEYIIERRGRVLRLARQQATGKVVSFMLGGDDARNLAAALFEAADQLENT